MGRHPTDAGRQGPASADEASDVGPVTALLRRSGPDRRAALDELVPIIYDTLRRMARQQLARERNGHTLVTTALAHEAYAKLIGLDRIQWRDRAHFFAAAAGAMRRVLVDYALARRADKRGGGATAVPIEGLPLADDVHVEDAVAVHEALERLQRHFPGAERVVECRVFAGMTIEETAAALDLSPATVKRQWAAARRWLARDLASREA
jgi:RNA polymerase sigma factor (TIGR02999 family)